jgi:hypothetical protein
MPNIKNNLNTVGVRKALINAQLSQLKAMKNCADKGKELVTNGLYSSSYPTELEDSITAIDGLEKEIELVYSKYTSSLNPTPFLTDLAYVVNNALKARERSRGGVVFLF